MVRALASHKCVPGSNPGPGLICGLSLLLVSSRPCSEGFSPSFPVFLPPNFWVVEGCDASLLKNSVFKIKDLGQVLM